MGLKLPKNHLSPRIAELLESPFKELPRYKRRMRGLDKIERKPPVQKTRQAEARPA